MKQTDFQKIANQAKNIYDFACYFLDLLYVGRNYQESTLTDILEYYKVFTEKGWMDADCFVKQPTKILEYVTNRKYSVTISKTIPKDAKFVIGYWFNKKTGFHHFVVMNKDNKVVWDSIPNSKTVQEGTIESYRIFRQGE